MLQVSIPKEVASNCVDGVWLFFMQKFVLCGQVFVAFLSKDEDLPAFSNPSPGLEVVVVHGDDARRRREHGQQRRDVRISWGHEAQHDGLGW